MRGRGHAGVGTTQADAVQRVVRNLAELYPGWMVWSVAPPGEPLADDGRPAPNAREPMSTADTRSLTEAEVGVPPLPPLPMRIITLARRALLIGAAASATRVYTPGGGFFTISIRGRAAEALKDELRDAGFVREKRRSSWGWAPAVPPPPLVPKPLPPVSRPPTRTPGVRPVLRVVR